MRSISPTRTTLFAEFSIQQERYPLLNLPATEEERMYVKSFKVKFINKC